MTLAHPSPGQNSPYEYMVSAIPWLTASTVANATTAKFDMPTVASSYEIRNMSAVNSLVFGFTAAGVAGTHYKTLRAGESHSADIRFVSIFIGAPSGSVSFEMNNGLTTIQTRYFTLSGALGI